ncbi:MAG TPA: hypothetical protein VI790_03680 [Candidatus Nanoarchaeia archaeon]|nr:hypothetical protein [Candidatus Nanoarchaeia archaeon]
MVLNIHLIGEMHLGNLNNNEAFLLDLTNDSFGNRLEDVYERFIPVFEEYEKIKGYIINFYRGLDELIKPDETNILFAEGKESKLDIFGLDILNMSLIKQGLNPDKFKQKYFLDSKSFYHTVLGEDNSKEREAYWVTNLRDKLASVNNASVYIMVGLHHLRPESIINEANLATSLKRDDLTITTHLMNYSLDDLNKKAIEMFKPKNNL